MLVLYPLYGTTSTLFFINLRSVAGTFNFVAVEI